MKNYKTSKTQTPKDTKKKKKDFTNCEGSEGTF